MKSCRKFKIDRGPAQKLIQVDFDFLKSPWLMLCQENLIGTLPPHTQPPAQAELSPTPSCGENSSTRGWRWRCFYVEIPSLSSSPDRDNTVLCVYNWMKNTVKCVSFVSANCCSCVVSACGRDEVVIAAWGRCGQSCVRRVRLHVTDMLIWYTHMFCIQKPGDK